MHWLHRSMQQHFQLAVVTLLMSAEAGESNLFCLFRRRQNSSICPRGRGQTREHTGKTGFFHLTVNLLRPDEKVSGLTNTLATADAGTTGL